MYGVGVMNITAARKKMLRYQGHTTGRGNPWEINEDLKVTLSHDALRRIRLRLNLIHTESRISASEIAPARNRTIPPSAVNFTTVDGFPGKSRAPYLWPNTVNSVAEAVIISISAHWVKGAAPERLTLVEGKGFPNEVMTHVIHSEVGSNRGQRNAMVPSAASKVRGAQVTPCHTTVSGPGQNAAIMRR